MKNGKKSKLSFLFGESIQWILGAVLLVLIALSGCSKEPTETCYECEVKTYTTINGVENLDYSDDVFCIPDTLDYKTDLYVWTFDSINAKGHEIKGQVYNCN